MAIRRAANLRKILNAKATLAAGLGVSRQSLRAKAHFVEHHLAHIGSSFYVSPFEQAAVLSIDGFGDMMSAKWGMGLGSHLETMGEVSFPHSLGVFYTAVTQYLGFPRYGDEYKVMGMASYGEAAYLDQFRRIVHSSGLDYKLSLENFRHHIEGAAMTWDGGSPELPHFWGPGLEALLGPARLSADEPLEQRHYNIAATLQRRLEEVVLEMLRELHSRTGVENLCLAGGVALNCVVNGKIFNETPFRRLYIQPAAYDGGTSVGAAFYVQHQLLKRPRSFVMNHAYYGPDFPSARHRVALETAGVDAKEFSTGEIVDRTADALAKGKIVGWYQGRLEFGPRALGNRSILTDPRRPEMQRILNARIKHREPFRPFAPVVLEEATGDWFTNDHPSPFMLLTYPVRPEKRNEIPAPTHVDGSGRLQTIRRDQNKRYYDLVRAFGERTGVPILLNTSFNENEPICCTPEEAVETFVRTRMDLLVLGNYYVEKHAIE